MERSTARIVALTIAPTVFLLAACSAGLTNAETDACNRVAAWIYGGQVADGFEDAVTKAQDALADVDETALADPLSVLASSAEGDQAADADAFMTVCEDHGWEPPEG
ncbi:hypothetical protein [Cellulomonas xiejunii]|uniref:hypothetical protein n=1 Tax=Cellulomonas xiejunii TaxID=2968083 RepID=UPI001D0EFCC1|nr:hypothetical protein [Cellulomonas xiejunii]MCC2313769.1 hypothetical protein [Cellulomonas xiejunii]